MSVNKVIVLFPIILSGCMMAGMPAMHGSSHERRKGTTLVKEVQTERITVVLEAPPLTAKKEAILLVSIRNDSTGEFISNAEVFAFIQEEQRRPDVEVRPRVKKQFEENTSEHVYQLLHLFAAEGWYEIEIEIWHGTKEEPPKVISIRKMVAVSKNPQSGMGTGFFVLAGGAGMLLMMGLMMAGVIF